MNISKWKRHNWKFVWREYKFIFLLVIAQTVMMGILFAITLFIIERDARVQAEQAHQSLIDDVKYMANLGRHTRIDDNDGTSSDSIKLEFVKNK